MARRFLTSEDLRRLAAGGKEVIVDEETIVTAAAQELARAHGILIVTGRGSAWKEPMPDRGPDAERAQRTLPHLPEPQGDPDEVVTGVVVTAVGRNRPGILAEITTAIAATQGSVHDISQKMVEGYFHMVVTVELPPGTMFGAVKRHMECLGGPEDYVVRVMHERVFRFMHRI